ncbi:MAG: sigma factor-like helix-turn-helix DNA-binding protein [Dehalococcoidia bacterium]
MIEPPTSSIIRMTIPEIFKLSRDEVDRVWDVFSRRTLSDSGVSTQYWDSAQKCGLYPEDSLEIVLALPLGSLVDAFPEDTAFMQVLQFATNLITLTVGKEVGLDAVELPVDDVPIFIGIDFDVLSNYSITPSFVPHETLEVLKRHNIKQWKDLREISEYQVMRQYGFSANSLKLVKVLWSVYPHPQVRDITKVEVQVRDIAKVEVSDINGNGLSSAFEDLVKSWLQSGKIRGSTDRNIEILMRRMGWSCDGPQTLESIGQQMQLTRERVRQIESRTTKALLKNTRTTSSVLHPLWIAVDSILANSCGVVSMVEMATKLQEQFGWQNTPSVSGLCNLMGFMPNQLSNQYFFVADSETLVRIGVPCLDCIEIGSHFSLAIAKAGEMPVSDMAEVLDEFCQISCPRHHKPPGPPGGSFIDLLLRRDELKRTICRAENKLYQVSEWNHKRGKLIEIAESVLMRSQRAMHFTEVSAAIRVERPEFSEKADHTVHSSLDRCDGILLWGRGTYIHRNSVEIPVDLIGRIIEWIESNLEAGLPFITSNGAFLTFHDECQQRGIPNEVALYTCLRKSSNTKLRFPWYPDIILASTDRLATDHQMIGASTRKPYLALVEEFFSDAGAPVALDEAREYFIAELGMKEFQLTQAVSNNPSIIRVARSTYCHVDNLAIDKLAVRRLLRELTEYAVKRMTKVNHISVKKVFEDNIVKCKVTGVHSPEMIHSLLRLYDSDRLSVERYPQIRLPGEEMAANHGIAQNIEEYIKSKKGFCTITELEKHFVDKLGYSPQSIYSVQQKGAVVTYMRGVLIHKQTIGWSQEKQDQLEHIAETIYLGSFKGGQCFGTIDQILEAAALPELDNDVLYSRDLLADLLTQGEKFLVVGNARNVYVPIDNLSAIKTFGDLVYVLLKTQYNGASNLHEFTDTMVDRGIILRRLTPSMLGDSQRVTILNNEILLTELLHHA